MDCETGTCALALSLLKANGVEASGPTKLLALSGEAATQAVIKRKADAASRRAIFRRTSRAECTASMICSSSAREYAHSLSSSVPAWPRARAEPGG